MHLHAYRARNWRLRSAGAAIADVVDRNRASIEREITFMDKTLQVQVSWLDAAPKSVARENRYIRDRRETSTKYVIARMARLDPDYGLEYSAPYMSTIAPPAMQRAL